MTKSPWPARRGLWTSFWQVVFRVNGPRSTLKYHSHFGAALEFEILIRGFVGPPSEAE
jgi:hypothetical protein